MREHLSSVELIERSIADHAEFKKAAELLAEREPNETAAHTLIRAFHSGAAPAWLTAVLLGRLRHRAGYSVVLEILEASLGSLSESYAGVALVRIAGRDARNDLLRVLTSSPHPKARRGAGYGLEELGELEPLVEAFRARRIPKPQLVGCAERLATDSLLTQWLAGPEPLRGVAERVMTRRRRADPPSTP